MPVPVPGGGTAGAWAALAHGEGGARPGRPAGGGYGSAWGMAGCAGEGGCCADRSGFRSPAPRAPGPGPASLHPLGHVRVGELDLAVGRARVGELVPRVGVAQVPREAGHLGGKFKVAVPLGHDLRGEERRGGGGSEGPQQRGRSGRRPWVTLPSQGTHGTGQVRGVPAPARWLQAPSCHSWAWQPRPALLCVPRAPPPPAVPSRGLGREWGAGGGLDAKGSGWICGSACAPSSMRSAGALLDPPCLREACRPPAFCR